MEPTDWAFNAAQINQDIGLANDHLPPDLQVPKRQVAVAGVLLCCLYSA